MISLRVPAGWDVCRIDEAGEVRLGQAKPTSSQPGQDVPYLRVANVQDNRLDLSDVATMHVPDNSRDRYRLNVGDILLCEGQSLELVGRAAMYRGELPEVYFQNSILLFRSNDNVLPEYALLVFRAFQKNAIFHSIAKATTNIAHLSLRRFSGLQFPLPPILEQRKIIAAAWDAQKEIDRSRAALQRLTAASRELLPITRTAVILGTENMVSLSETACANTLDWTVLSKATYKQSPIVYGILQPGPDILDGTGIPYVRGKDLQDGRILITQLKRTTAAIASAYPRAELKQGDILVGIVGHTRVSVVPPELDGGSLTQGAAKVRPAEWLDSEYLAHWISSSVAQQWLREHIHGMAIPRIDLKDLRRLPLPVVDQERQLEISAHLNAFTKQVNILGGALKSLSGSLEKLERQVLFILSLGSDNEFGPDTDDSASSITMQQAADAADVLRRGGPKMTRLPTGKRQTQVDAELIFLTLAELGGSVAAEQLWTALNVDREYIDDFYLSLRTLIRRQLIEVADIDSVSTIRTTQ